MTNRRKPQHQPAAKPQRVLFELGQAAGRIADTLELGLKALCIGAGISPQALREAPDASDDGSQTLVETQTAIEMQRAELEARVREALHLDGDALLPPEDQWPPVEED